MIAVGKSINSITINGNEWLLKDDGSLMLFPSKEKAISFLKLNGFINLSNEEFEDDFIFKSYNKKRALKSQV